MTRAVVYGLLVTALAQGVIAGIGYWIFGLEAPALLGALTGLLLDGSSSEPPSFGFHSGVGFSLRGILGKASCSWRGAFC